MNIDETYADGWTYVRFGDAAKAAQEGTHEVQCEAECQFGSKRWFMHDDETAFFDANKYRIREKARTITVTDLPIPLSAERGVVTARIILDYAKEDQSAKALSIIRAAMEAQP